ncbi:MAG: response regulator [Desulfobacteraceae bacterium]|nr:response regulator [Desulfobacteraceae bacterium]
METPDTRPTILMVDDTPENLFALEQLTSKLDINIVTAASGNEALNQTLHHDFSLILLDVLMPEMNGYEVAELLQKNERTASIPIIFISAMDKSDIMEIKGYSMGAVDFIFKPINQTVLTSKIKVHLELYQMRRTVEAMMLKQKTEKPKILTVDDHPENLFVLDKLLKKLDADIIQANSGNEALAKVLDHDFALIILDVQMPEMDGYEVAEILKYDDRTEKIPIIFVTAIDRDDAKEIKGYHKGAVDFIFKPLNEFILLSKVKVFLELYKIKHGLERLVTERTQELKKNNEQLKAEITKNVLAKEDLAESRTYLMDVINAISSSLISVDAEGNVLDMNKAAEKLARLLADDARGKPIGVLLPWFDWLTGEAVQAIATGTPLEKTRVAVSIGGKHHVNDLGVYPLSSTKNQGAVVRIDDVTDRARMDEIMIQSEKMLSLGGLAGGMAHEINNPLAGIIQNIQVMSNRMKGDLPKNLTVAKECGTTIEILRSYMEKREIFQMVDTIMEAGRRAAQIVENMLSFSRKSEGRPKPEIIEKLMDKTIELAENDYDLKKNFDFRQVEIIRDFQPGMPPVVCQASKIQQVLLNLLKNGAHAMADKEGPSRFNIGIAMEDGMACMRVTDNGTGMDKALCKRIFEPFFSTKKSGTGLGLSIAYFIITEDHDGTIEVESAPGKGTTFIIRLPMVDAPA